MGEPEIYFNLHPVNFLIISGVLQSYVVAVILFFRRSDRLAANKYLAATIFIVNLHLTYLMLLDLNLDNLYPSLLWMPYSYLTAIGPLLFLYTKYLTNAEFRISVKDYFHFIPTFIEVLLQVAQIVYGITHQQMYYNTPFYFFVTPVVYLWAAGSIYYYLHLSLALIENHQTWIFKNFSNLKEVTLSWLQRLVSYYRVLWMAWTPFIIVFLLFFRFQLQYLAVVLVLYLLILIITYLTYWIGIQGLIRVNPIFIPQNVAPVENKNFHKLTGQEIDHHINRMVYLMDEEKLFLNEYLNLKEFAIKVGAEPNLISYILNTHLKKNFHEFINYYRVEEVKLRIGNPKYKHLTILAVALESGFNSKTTFNRLFKQMTGLTPREFQKRKKHEFPGK